MTDIVFKPEPKSGTVNGRGLYRAFMNKKPLDLLFRAKTAGEADAMLQFMLTRETAGKTICFDLKKFTEETAEEVEPQ